LDSHVFSILYGLSVFHKVTEHSMKAYVQKKF